MTSVIYNVHTHKKKRLPVAPSPYHLNLSPQFASGSLFSEKHDECAFIRSTGKITIFTCSPSPYQLNLSPQFASASQCAIITSTAKPPTYFRALILWLLDCADHETQSNFTESYTAALSALTRLKPSLIKVLDETCVSGNRPYCGVDVASHQAHHRARRLAAGGRAKMAGGGKKSSDDDKDKGSFSYNGGVPLKCDGVAVNMTVDADQNVLENLRELLVNGSLVLPMWNGNITPAFMLSAMKGVLLMWLFWSSLS